MVSLPSFSGSSSGPCEQCKILVGIVNELKDRCYELTDEVGANQDMVTVLRQTLIKANHQVEILKSMLELRSPRDRVNFLLERESEVTALQLNAAEHGRELRALRERIRDLEERNNELSMAIDAFRDSVRTKEELIMKLCREQDGVNESDAKSMLELRSPRDRVNFILERESEVTALQLNAAEHGRELRALRERIRDLEERNNELSMAIDAFRDSVRTKEELIMKLCREQDGVNESDASVVNEGETIANYRDLEERNNELSMAIDAFRDSVRTKEELIMKLCREQDGVNESDASVVNEVDVPEGILVDFGNAPGDENAQRVFDEAAVNDVTEMRDLVEGYRGQNMFLNQEVLELQRIVQSLEDRERRIIRQNFDIEACYYQLKSRYIMVLNHFKAEDQASRVLEPGVIEELIDETNWTAEKRKLANDRTELRLTDSLGFYLDNNKKQHRRMNSTDMLDVAVHLKVKSDEIIGKKELEQSPQYIDWLQKWDGFLVNTVSRPLKPSDELKALIRTGVPKTYRGRVWKRSPKSFISTFLSDSFVSMAMYMVILVTVLSSVRSLLLTVIFLISDNICRLKL
uniref:RH1 domain-containing protein n=1 Tax=Ascaris lumbricoides TaxID=6252 RepID=A0A0M3IRM3_ASCLU